MSMTPVFNMAFFHAEDTIQSIHPISNIAAFPPLRVPHFQKLSLSVLNDNYRNWRWKGYQYLYPQKLIAHLYIKQNLETWFSYHSTFLLQNRKWFLKQSLYYFYMQS